MDDRARVPDAFYHAALWLGVCAFMILFGMGFVARAEDHAPWFWWLSSLAAFLPFASVVWLERSGLIVLVDTEKIEVRWLMRLFSLAVWFVPGRLRFAACVVLAMAGLVFGAILEIAAWHSDALAQRLEAFAGGFSHPEYAAWALAAAGLFGAAWEAVAVAREANARETGRRG